MRAPGPCIGLSATPRVVDVATGPTLLHTVSRFYVDSIVRAGGIPVVVPVVPVDLVQDIVVGLAGVLLTGGGDVDPSRYGRPPEPETSGVDAARDDFDVALLRAAVGARLPVLAICRGAQVLNVAFGGTLVQHVPRATGTSHASAARSRDPVHAVHLDPSCRLAHVVGVADLEVNSVHHQAVELLGPGVRAVGWAPDGTIEALELVGHPEVLAVQWHPELLDDAPAHRALFQWLVGAAGGYETP